MEFTKNQIAVLVLGYLKSERCMEAFEEFLESSENLKDVKDQAKSDRYFVTRIGGLSLVDYLEEYASIYSIIQGRLEVSNFFSEHHSRATLVDQLLYLLDNGGQHILNSTPITNCGDAVETTQAEFLPGNKIDSQSKVKRKGSKNKCSQEDVMEVSSEVLTQTLLEHQFHEKIAQTINNVTQEITKSDHNLTTGASKELEAIIKTVVQETEKDPEYNKLLDEIMGIPTDNGTGKNCTTTSKATNETYATEVKSTQSQTSTIEDHMHDAVHSIIAASSQTPVKSVAMETSPQTNDVYVFDGNLDAYIRTTNPANPLYINTSINTGLVMVPPEQSKFLLVNNQPFRDSDIMAMPTVIVNDKVESPLKKVNVNPRIVPKPSVKTLAPKDDNKERQAARNLNFSSPTVKKSGKAWDADLRSLVVDKSSAKKKPKKTSKQSKEKEKQKAEVEPKLKPEDDQKPKPDDVSSIATTTEEESIKSNDSQVEAIQKENETSPKTSEKPKDPVSETPLKEEETCPKTPGLGISFGTPFNDVLNEHLRGVDLTSIPTPKLPITPGFALTPNCALTPNGDSGCCNRKTDYSTSSSYYQPSDSEQNKSLEQMLEECKTIEKREKETNKNCTEHLKKFNENVIGKKNLNLIKPSDSFVTISSEDSSDESEPVCEKTVICITTEKTTDKINEIINTVEVKKTLDSADGDDKKELLSHLAEVRQRTIKKLKKEVASKPKRTSRAKRAPKIPPKVDRPRRSKKTEPPPAETDEAKKLVDGLKERGIHLVPNKSPVKKIEPEVAPPNEEQIEETLINGLQRKIYDTFEIMRHNERFRSKVTYNLELLNKTFNAKLFDEDLQDFVDTRVAWTPFTFLTNTEVSNFKTPLRPDTAEEAEESDLMDFVLTVKEDSPVAEVKNNKGKRKRKRPSDDEKHIDKKSKTSVNLKLLNEIGVDDFLDKVHGE